MNSEQNKVYLLIEDEYISGEFRTQSEHSSYDEALKEACRLYDSGKEDFFRVVSPDGSDTFIRPWTLELVECPECGKKVRLYDMEQTFDCHGIPYRKVCYKCKRRIEATVGYDGEYYTEADECLGDY